MATFFQSWTSRYFYVTFIALTIVNNEIAHSQSIIRNLNQTLIDNNSTAHMLQDTAYELITRLKKVTKESSEKHEMDHQNYMFSITKALRATEKHVAEVHLQNQRKLDGILNKFIPSRQNTIADNNNSSDPKLWTFTKTTQQTKSKDERTAILEKSIEQNRRLSNTILNSLKTDILRLSSAEIRREDILNFIRSKQPSFSYSDANNLLIDAHMTNNNNNNNNNQKQTSISSSNTKAKAAAAANRRRAQDLPKSNMDSFSQAREMKDNRAIENFVKSSIALEFNRMNLLKNDNNGNTTTTTAY